MVILTNVDSSEYYPCINTKLVSSTSMMCKIPAALPAGNFSVKLSAGNQNASTGLFGKNSLAPVVTSISPSEGSPLGNTSISIEVENLINFNGVYFNYTLDANNSYAFQANQCQRTNLTNLICKTPPVPFSASFGISVIEGSIIGNIDFYFTYFSPNVTSIVPNVGSNDGGYLIEIRGQNFGTGINELSPPLVSFGTYQCANVRRVSDNLITCIASEVNLFSQ